MEDFELLGPRIRIRRARIDEAEARFRWFANPTVTEYLPLAGEQILPLADVLAFLEKATRDDDPNVSIRIELLDGRVIGCGGLRNIVHGESAEVSVVIGEPDVWSLAGGGRNELADLRAPQNQSDLAPFVRGAFRQRPHEGYFFRAEFQAHFASVLETRRADPDFWSDPYARYGGRSLHTRSHGEAFLSVFSAWLSPGMILMDEPEAALSPQRQLALLSQTAKLARTGGVQMIIATHSPIILTFPGASILAFDEVSNPLARLEIRSSLRGSEHR